MAGRVIVAFWHRSHVAFLVVAAMLIGVVALGIDEIASAGHMRPGVHIGQVDVSGMDADEARSAVAAVYEGNLASTTAFIFDSAETEQSADIDELMVQEEAYAEQISLEDSLTSKQMWRADAEMLGARLPLDQLVQEALAVGHGSDQLSRIPAALFGREVPVRLDFDEESMSKLIGDIDVALGVVMSDWGVQLTEGAASIVAGNDGEQIDPAAFAERITELLLADAEARKTMVAELVFVPVRIDEAAAQATCDAVNAALQEGASFTYDGKTLDTPASMLGEWVVTEPVQVGGDWRLAPSFDREGASSSIATSLTVGETGSTVAVSFDVSGDQVMVMPDSEVVVPSVDDAVLALDAALFGAYRDGGSYEQRGERFGIPIDAATASGPFTFDEAIANGVITRISTYTTSYTNTESTQNRNWNIHRASDVLDRSVVRRDGGEWSFTAIAGEASKENGYKDANTIVDGEIVQEAGGGVCQVSTTVFNAVYESGLPIAERHNHTLRMSSYPDGRDAAIAYPFMDLRWKNDTDSDVLVRMSYTDTTVTASLYGVALGYEVSTQTSDWQPGEEFATKVKVDETKPQGYKKTQTLGTDGVSISVVRTVTGKNGESVRIDRFDSVYSPVDKVIVTGPDTPVDLEEESESST